FWGSAGLDDIRKYGCNFMNYVGKPLSYILARPERPDDTDNPLRVVFGNEAADLDIERFAKRFDVRVIDNYGSTESGAAVIRVPETPRGALGRGDPSGRVLDPATGGEGPVGVVDAEGRPAHDEQGAGRSVGNGR